MAAPLRATVAPEEAVRNGILCLAHGCDSKRTKIFSFSFPAICPVCNEDLTQSELPLPPFRIPFPFVRAQQRALSLVIRPTQGDFLQWV
ncbi:unnamed protein product [Cyprideis torosa]|uniref:Uncharacterized protein n=1 Tax=Cyprideis torosa TaxID=163714 RepID=A0A7R8WVC8_9CRUS|nr:unnamed protein product [Cyprideis torosa]CAG0907191.1 unnamed protein product [Cyprideis torosa]